MDVRPFPLSSSSAAPREFLSPFDGSVFALVHESSAMDVIQSLAPAKKAMETASQIFAVERSSWFARMADRLAERAAHFAMLEAECEGLPASVVLEKSIRPTERLLRAIAGELASASASAEEGRRATGLTAIIAPAGFAFRSIGDRLVPALAAGNAVFVKVPSKSPVAAAMWAELLEFVPSGLAHLFLGRGSEIGALLCAHPSVRAVSFAGRPETATKVIAAAAPSLKKLQVSAGIKNSLVLLPDADLRRWPEIIAPAILGGGRLGWGFSRIFVTEARVEEVTSLLRSSIMDLVPLTNAAGTSSWTPLDSQVRSSALRFLDQARAENAKILAGGEFEGDRHLRPVVVRDLSNCSPLQLEDLAAPFLILDVVKYAHEVAKWTNTGDYGFCASVWGDHEKAARIGTKLDVGRVWVNGWMQEDGAFAGWRKSFFGIPDFSWNGSFFSDVRSLTVPTL